MIMNCVEEVGRLAEVRRDRTAIARSDLSRPVQRLIGSGVLSPEHSLFDYGCGLGDDVRFLRSLGYVAHGWDPAHRPDEALQRATVVNLGYVLNVIERPAERAQALRRAYDLAETCLCVSVLIGSASYAGEVQAYGDGVLTSRNTFQRYYRQEEVAGYLQEVIGIVPIPLEAGVFLIFRRSEDAHAFLLNRLQRAVPLIHGVPRQRKRLLRAALLEAFQKEHKEDWAEYADFVAGHGRPPATVELRSLQAAAEHGLGPSDLWEAAASALSQSQLKELRRVRTNQYIVFMAISRFRGIPRLGDLSVTARFDIRYYFRSYIQLKELSNKHLFAAGDEERVAQLCEAAPVGVNTADGYFVARRDLSQLDPTLQIYARLGELFYGDLDRMDIVKIHKTSPRLSLFSLNDLNEAVPRLKTRVKIDLQGQQVRFFDHSENVEPEVLVGKQLLGFDQGSTEQDLVVLGRRILMLDSPFGLIVRESSIRGLT